MPDFIEPIMNRFGLRGRLKELNYIQIFPHFSKHTRVHQIFRGRSGPEIRMLEGIIYCQIDRVWAHDLGSMGSGWVDHDAKPVAALIAIRATAVAMRAAYHTSGSMFTGKTRLRKPRRLGRTMLEASVGIGFCRPNYSSNW